MLYFKVGKTETQEFKVTFQHQHQIRISEIIASETPRAQSLKSHKILPPRIISSNYNPRFWFDKTGKNPSIKRKNVLSISGSSYPDCRIIAEISSVLV